MNKCIRSVVTPLVTPLTGGSASKTPLTSGPASKTQFAVTIDPHKSVIQVSLGSQVVLLVGSQVVLPLTPLTMLLLVVTSLLQAVCLHDNDLRSF